MKKPYFLIVLLLCGLSVGNVFAAASTRTWTNWIRSLLPGETATKGYLGEELRAAATKGNQLDVERLIARGADVNAANRQGTTVLISAAQWSSPAIVETLLQAGADVNAANPRSRETALMGAADVGRKNIVETLLKAKGIDVNATNYEGFTALMYAAIEGHENIVNTLLQADEINVNATTNNGWTALMWAAAEGYKNIVTMLLDAGADKTIQTALGRTAEAIARDARYDDHNELADMISGYTPSGRTVKRALTG